MGGNHSDLRGRRAVSDCILGDYFELIVFACLYVLILLSEDFETKVSFLQELKYAFINSSVPVDLVVKHRRSAIVAWLIPLNRDRIVTCARHSQVQRRVRNLSDYNLNSI